MACTLTNAVLFFHLRQHIYGHKGSLSLRTILASSALVMTQVGGIFTCIGFVVRAWAFEAGCPADQVENVLVEPMSLVQACFTPQTTLPRDRTHACALA